MLLRQKGKGHTNRMYVHYIHLQMCLHMQKAIDRTWTGCWALLWVCTSNESDRQTTITRVRAYGAL